MASTFISKDIREGPHSTPEGVRAHASESMNQPRDTSSTADTVPLTDQDALRFMEDATVLLREASAKNEMLEGENSHLCEEVNRLTKMAGARSRLDQDRTASAAGQGDEVLQYNQSTPSGAEVMRVEQERRYDVARATTPTYAPRQISQNRFNDDLRKTVPNFKGDDEVSVTAYLRQFAMIRREYGWDDQTAGFHLVRALVGKAIQVLSTLPDDEPGFEVLAQALRDKYEPSTQMEAYQNQFEYRNRDVKRETPHEYAEKLKEMAVKAFPFMNTGTTDFMVRRQFQNGQPSGVRNMLSLSPDLNTLDKCVRVVSKFEASVHNNNMRRVGSKPGNTYVPNVNAMERDEGFETEHWNDAFSDLEGEQYDVSRVMGKFNAPKRAPNHEKSYPGAQSRKFRESDTVQRLEVQMEELKRMIEAMSSYQMRGSMAGNAPSGVLSINPGIHACEAMEEEELTIVQLMAMVGYTPPANPKPFACWYCDDKGHRFGQCGKLREWLMKRLPDRKGSYPAIQATPSSSLAEKNQRLN